jgi:hypothetical protein
VSNGFIILTHNTYLESFEYWIKEAENEKRLQLISYNECYTQAQDRLASSIRMLSLEINKKYCE